VLLNLRRNYVSIDVLSVDVWVDVAWEEIVGVFVVTVYQGQKTLVHRLSKDGNTNLSAFNASRRECGFIVPQFIINKTPME